MKKQVNDGISNLQMSCCTGFIGQITDFELNAIPRDKMKRRTEMNKDFNKKSENKKDTNSNNNSNSKQNISSNKKSDDKNSKNS